MYPFYHSKGGLNYGNLNDAGDGPAARGAAPRNEPRGAEGDLEEGLGHATDQVWDVFLPEPAEARGFWHNYVLGYRPFPSGLSCYGNSQLRGAWLDEGAPKVGVMLDEPEGLLL